MGTKLAELIKQHGEAVVVAMVEAYITSRVRQRTKAKEQREKAKAYDEYMAKKQAA